MAPHYIITVSEGRFRVLERFARPGHITPTLREVASHDFMPAASAYSAREINQIGHGSTNLLRHLGQGAGGSAPPHDDEHRRTVDWLSEQIEHFLLARPGQAWALAAGPNLHNPILERLRPSVRGSLVESVQKNLALTPPAELATHFRVRA
jgi:hypothetical protein